MLGGDLRLESSDARQRLRLLRVTLDSAGWAVHDAESGARVLAEASYFRPDCVVLDLGLPDLAGVEVHREYLRVHLAALRRKLGAAVVIRTEPGIGNRFRND
ncbi:MAG: response regulator [Verrucomicrobiota bacterium]